MWPQPSTRRRSRSAASGVLALCSTSSRFLTLFSCYRIYVLFRLYYATSPAGNQPQESAALCSFDPKNCIILLVSAYGLLINRKFLTCHCEERLVRRSNLINKYENPQIIRFPERLLTCTGRRCKCRPLRGLAMTNLSYGSHRLCDRHQPPLPALPSPAATAGRRPGEIAML